MEYRSFNDLADAASRYAYKLPPDLDLIVGIPRSGSLAANLLALQLNLAFLDLDSFLEGREPRIGRTAIKTLRSTGGRPRHVLVVDDSILTGKSMAAVREEVRTRRPDVRATYCAIYGAQRRHAEVDVILEVVPQPRCFQWNLMRHQVLENSCVDIDGVLCHDPNSQENDDGPAYRQFLSNGRPLLRPGRKVKHLVTSRLERYRPETEAWLATHGIDYEKLWMLDLESAEQRRKLKAHAPHKAAAYKESGAILFIESEHKQSVEIAEMSGLPVLDLEEQMVVWPASEARARERHESVVRRKKKESGLYRWSGPWWARQAHRFFGHVSARGR